MDAKPSLTLYNPDLLSKTDLIRGFVARKSLLDKLLDDLRRTASEGSPQHHLLLGQRGLGKTTLLRRLAFAIDDNPELATIWQPLTFPEEQYNVTSLAEFWLNCADALSDALERSGRKAEAESLDQRVESMTGKDSAEALATLLDEAQRLNRKLVLLVDNIDIVLERIGKDQEWELRRNLTENTALTVIGGSSRAIEAFYEHDRAFYDFFQVHELKGLDDDEAKALLNHLAKELNSEQVDRILKEQPARLRALRLLTGGNPRTLVLLFRVFEQGPEGDVQRDLEQLLDLYTPLYKARFEELPKQAQDVVDEIALNWDPVTAADVARLTGLHINIASSQLQRLLELGVIEKVPWFGAKKTGFQIAERFFNIWYLMRASRRLRRKLVWLVKFLQAWFTEEELQDRARNLLDGGAQKLGSERYAELNFAYAQATTGDRRLRMRLEHAGLRAVMETDDAVRQMFDLSDLPKDLLDKKQRMEKMRELGEAVVRSREDWGGIDPTEFWRLLGGSPFYDMAEKQRMAEGLAELSLEQLKQLHERLKDAEFRVRNYCSSDRELVTLLYATLQNGEMADALDWESAVAATGNGELACLAIACRVNERFRKPDASMIATAEKAYQDMAEEGDLAHFAWNGLGNLLAAHLDRPIEAERAHRRSIELDPNYARPWYNLGKLLTYYLNRPDEAEQAYRRYIELAPKDASPWNNLANLLTTHLNRHEEAELAYRRSIELDPHVAVPWNNLALLTTHLNRHEEAERAYRNSIELDPKLAYPNSNLARLLRQTNRLPEATHYFLAAIKIDPQRSWDIDQVIDSIQELSRDKENLSTAEQLAREAIAVLPDNPSTKLLLAEVLTRAKNWSEARAIAEPIFTNLAAEPDASITAFCAAAVATRKTAELLELFDQTGTNERWRPLYEAIQAVQAGSKLYLRRVSPEVRHLAQRLLKEIAPNLGE